MKIRIGIVGIGGMGRTRLKWLRENPRVEIAGICDAKEEAGRRAAAECGVPFFASLEQILKRKLDGVTISVPNRLHADYALAALRADKHVLVEYPMATGLTDARKMIALAKRKKLILHVGLTDRYEPWFLALREDLPNAGRPITANSQWFGQLRGWYPDPYLRGDIFSFLHHHRISQYLAIFGDADRVTGTISETEQYGRTVHVVAIALVEFKKGPVASFTWGLTAPTPPPYEMLCCEKATYLIHDNGRSVEKITAAGRQPLSPPNLEPYRTDTNHFINEISTGEHVIPPEEALRVLRITTALNRSVRTGTIAL